MPVIALSEFCRSRVPAGGHLDGQAHKSGCMEKGCKIMVSFPALQTLSSLRDRESDSALTSDGDLRDSRIVPYTPGKRRNKVYLNVWVIIFLSSDGLKQGRGDSNLLSCLVYTKSTSFCTSLFSQGTFFQFSLITANEEIASTACIAFTLGIQSIQLMLRGCLALWF